MVKNAVFSYYEKIGDDIESIDAEIPFNLPDNWIWCRGYSCFSGMESTKPQGEFFDYIDIDSITRSAFYNTQFNKDVYIVEGCKQLEKWCFNSAFYGQIYLPKSITKIESMAFPDHMYSLDILHYAGTIDQFNELTKDADANVRHKIVDVGVWPEIVHCSDGDWTSSRYDSNK